MKTEIALIPIARIRVVNPRVRDKRKFVRVLESIRNVGLKKPIQVSPRGVPVGEPPAYDLICGQGRMEAFQMLGQEEIPAIVMEVNRKEAMLLSLIENMARRTASPLELVDEMIRLKACGYSNIAIGKKLDVSNTMVGDLITLSKAGEGRLLYEAIKGNIPIGLAVEIAKVETADQQKQFLEAYEKSNLNQAAVRTVKRVMVQRDVFGKKLGGMPTKSRCTSAEGLLNAFKKESLRQRLLVKKAKVCDARLLFIVEAMRRLRNDEDFVTLLRAENIDTMPRELSDMIAAQ